MDPKLVAVASGSYTAISGTITGFTIADKSILAGDIVVFNPTTLLAATVPCFWAKASAGLITVGFSSTALTTESWDWIAFRPASA